jgi:hypothetical protein
MISKQQLSIAAAGEKAFESHNSDLLLSFDSLAGPISAYARLEGQAKVTEAFDESDFEALCEEAFAELYQRGAIKPVRPISSRGQEQLRFLLTVYAVQPAKEAIVTQEDPDARFREVARMHKELSSAELKAWLNEVPERWALHEEAALRGMI